jgi:hypothetical protein
MAFMLALDSLLETKDSDSLPERLGPQADALFPERLVKDMDAACPADSDSSRSW